MTIRERALTFRENAHKIDLMIEPEIPLPIPSRKLSALLSYLQERGVDPGGFVGNLESRPEAWKDSETSIPLDLWVALCRSASRALDDPDFGLGLGRNFYGMPTMVGHLMGACRTLGEALNNYVLYQEIELHSWRLELEQGLDEIVIKILPVHDLAGDRLILDFVLASFLGTARRLTGTDQNLKKVSFSYDKPARTSLHEEIFSCPLEFSKIETTLTVPRAELETSVCSASREVHDLLESALIKALQQHNGERKYSIKVQEAVTRLKGGVAPDIRSVSRDLGFGTRDLQLKLKQEGTTFRKLKDDCQSKLAAEYLKDTSLGIKEIAYILGFSDSRAFHRAFVRWTGETPGEARKELRDSGKV